MYKNVLEHIPGIEYYPVLALILFFGFFLGLIVWFFRTDKQRMEHLSTLPLDDVRAPGSTPARHHYPNREV